MDNMRTKVNRQPALARQVADILQKEIGAGLYAPGGVFPSESGPKSYSEYGKRPKMSIK